MSACIANAPAIGLVQSAAQGSDTNMWNPPEPPKPIELAWKFVPIPHYYSPEGLTTNPVTFDTIPDVKTVSYSKPKAPFQVEGGSTIDGPDLGPVPTFDVELEKYKPPSWRPDPFAGVNPGKHTVGVVGSPGTVTVPAITPGKAAKGTTTEVSVGSIGVTVDDVDVDGQTVDDLNITGVGGYRLPTVGDVNLPAPCTGLTLDTSVDTGGLGDPGNLDGIGYIDPLVGIGDTSLSLIGAIIPAEIGQVAVTGLGEIGDVDINVPLFTDPAPVFNIEVPDLTFDYDPAIYTESVLADTVVEIKRMLNGEIAIPENVWQMMYDRAVDREAGSGRRAVDEAANDFAARGWSAPGGVLDKRIRQARQKALDARSGFNRDVFVKHAEMEMESMKFAITQGIAAEQIYANIFLAMEEMRYKASTMQSQLAIQYVEMQVAIINAEVAVFAAKADVYKIQVEAEIARLEAYRIKLEADRVKLDVAKLYLDGDRVYLDGQRVTIEGDRLLIDGQKLELEADRLTLAGAGLELDADKVKLDVARTTLAGDEVQIKAIGVDQAATQQDIDIARVGIECKQTAIEAEKVVLDADRVKLAKITTGLENDKARISAKSVEIDNKKVQVSAAGLGVDIARAKTEASLAEIENDKLVIAGKDLEIRAKALLIERQKANIQAYNAEVGLLAVAVSEHNAQVGAMRGQVDLENAKVSAFKGQVDAYGTDAQVYAALWGGYEAEARAEGVKADFYKAAASGYAAEVDGFKSTVEAEAVRIDAEFKTIEISLERMKADAQRYSADSQGEAARVSSLSDAYRTEMSGYSTKANVAVAQSNAYTEKMRLLIDNAKAAATAAIEGARIASSEATAYSQALAQAQDTVAKVNAQISASELGQYHASASTKHSASWSTVCDI